MGRLRKGTTISRDGVLYARVQWTDDSGKRKQKEKRATSPSHANTLIKKMLREIDDYGPEYLETERITFAQLADFYEKHCLIPAVYVDGRKVAGRRSLRTPKAAVTTLKIHFGKRRLRAITYGDIARFRSVRIATPTIHNKARSIASVNRELEVLRNMFNVAYREGWILKNPFNSGPPLIQKAHEKKRERILTPDEENRLLQVCTGRRTHLKPILICALDCGLRRGELLTLTWADVDLDEGLINLKAYNTKTEQARTVGITPRLDGELRALYQQSTRDPQERVFGVTDTFKKSFASACEDAGITGMRPHDLRHTCATRWVEAGVPLAIVSKLLGHTTQIMTSRYVNTDARTARLAVEALVTLKAKYEDSQSSDAVQVQ